MIKAQVMVIFSTGIPTLEFIVRFEWMCELHVGLLLCHRN